MFEGIVHNHGNTHVRAGARVDVEGAGIFEEVLLKPVTVLPGSARRVYGEWQPETLQPGKYIAHFRPLHPHAAAEATALSFHILKPYELAAARPQIEQFEVRATSGFALAMEALIANRGNVSGEARLVVQVTDEKGSELIRHHWDLSAIGPGVARLVEDQIPIAASRPGGYLVEASLWHDNQAVAQEQRMVRHDPTTLAAR